MFRRLLVLALLMLPLAAAAATSPDGEKIKEAHRVAARHYYENYIAGLKMTGTVEQNGSPGTFEAYSYNGKYMVREKFGAIDSWGYSSSDEIWSGCNYALPYKLEREDNPADWVLNLVGSGRYLEDPYWQSFNYVGEEAGGYIFNFTPEGLPPVEMVLYSDPEDPQYLQVMSAEVSLSPFDSASMRHRGYYQYSVDAQGRVFTQRETSRNIDPNGDTANYSEYKVTSVVELSAEPPELAVDFSRQPYAKAAQNVAAPVEIPIDISTGFMKVPVTFSGSDKTFYFIFDTGASASLFTPEAAAAAGVEPVLNIPAHGHGSRADFSMGMCTTASLGEPGNAAGQNLPLDGIPVAVIAASNTDLLGAMAFHNVGGILGISVLNQYVATFDAATGKITFIPPQLFDVQTHVGTPNVEYWLDVEDLAYVKGKITAGEKSLEGEVVIDSGLQHDLSLLGETLERAGITLEKTGQHDNTVVGGVQNFSFVNVPNFELGPLNWQNIEAAVSSDDQGSQSARSLLGYIGVSFFFADRVTLDLFNQRMYVQPAGEQQPFTPATPEAEQAPGETKQPSQTDDKGAGKSKLPVDIG